MKNICFARVLKTVLRCRWCNRIQSLWLSIRWGGCILVAPKTQCRIAKTAKVSIRGVLEINRPWDGRQVFPASFVINDSAELNVEGSFSFYSGCDVSVNEGAVLCLHSGFMNSNAQVAVFSCVSIGDGVVISNDVIIRDSDNHSIIRENYSKTEPVIIEDHVWIGLRSVVLKGSMIRTGAVVGAGSIVRGLIPAKTMAAGVPCKVIREVEWER